MSANKQRAKGRKILASTKIHAPTFNVLDYKLSMVQCLNYYSAEVENKDKRKFAYEYWRKNGHDPKKLDSLADSWFSTVGAVAHMILLDYPIHDTDRIKLDNAFHQLLDEVAKEKALEQPYKTKAPVNVQDHIRESAISHIGEIEGWLDQLTLNGTETSCKDYLSANAVKPPVIRYIVDFLKAKSKELTEVLTTTDKELLEGYSNFGKRKLKPLVAYIDNMITECNTVAQITRTVKAPRVRKPQPAIKLVAKMKYKKESAELRLKSIHPEKIVGADCVFLFDTAKRRLVKYEAMDGYSLTVKGTTILNWNPEKSGSKIIRKPEVQLATVSTMSKRPLSALFNEINGTVARVTGRTNDDSVIMKAF